MSAPLDAEGAVRLLASMLARSPRLPDAVCVGRCELFDDRRGDEDIADADLRHRQAVQLCHACPCLDGCRDWTARLRGRQRPGGVVAGQLPKPSRPRKEKPHDQ